MAGDLIIQWLGRIPRYVVKALQFLSQMQDLTGDPEDIIQRLDDIPETPWENICDSFDLGSIFYEM